MQIIYKQNKCLKLPTIFQRSFFNWGLLLSSLFCSNHLMYLVIITSPVPNTRSTRYLFIYLFVYSFIYLFIYFFYCFICLFVGLFNYSHLRQSCQYENLAELHSILFFCALGMSLITAFRYLLSLSTSKL